MAVHYSPGDEDAIYTYLDILLQLGQYPAVLKQTELWIRRGVQLTWWMDMSRAVACKLADKNAKDSEKAALLAELGMASFPAEAERMFDLALAAVDAKNDEDAAAVLVGKMYDSMGGKWTTQRLENRVHARWVMQLCRLYMRAQDWASAMAAADRLGAVETDLAGRRRSRP